MIVYFEKWTRRYWPTQGDAKDAVREARVCGGDAAGFVKVDVPTTDGRDRLCEFLNDLEDAARNAVQPSLSRDEIINSNTPEAQAAARELMAPSYTHQSISIDEAWDALPVARKLHFAALAMEAARDALP